MAAAAAGQPRRAARLLGEARLEAAAFVLNPPDRIEVGRLMATIRAGRDAAVFAAAREESCAMSLDRVVVQAVGRDDLNPAGPARERDAS